MRQPALICLGAGLQQVPLVEAALTRGLAVLAFDRNPEAPGLARATLGIAASTHDPEAILTRLADEAARFDYRGVVCRSTGKALETQARVASALGLRGLTPEAVRIATSKSELRAFCEARGLRMPKGCVAGSPGEVSLDLPVVVKPDYTVVGKENVCRIDREEDLERALELASSSSGNDRVEVEEYVDGHDVACLFWMTSGLAYALAYYDELIATGPKGELVPLGVSLPTQLDGTERAAVHELASGFATALPDVNALMILSVRVDADGLPHVIELHADLGGDLIADRLFPAACPAFDYFGTVVDLATRGLRPAIEPNFAPSVVLYRGGGEPGESGESGESGERNRPAAHLDAYELAQADTACGLLELVEAEVRRRGAAIHAPPPVLTRSDAGSESG